MRLNNNLIAYNLAYLPFLIFQVWHKDKDVNTLIIVEASDLAI